MAVMTAMRGRRIRWMESLGFGLKKFMFLSFRGFLLSIGDGLVSFHTVELFSIPALSCVMLRGRRWCLYVTDLTRMGLFRMEMREEYTSHGLKGRLLSISGSLNQEVRMFCRLRPAYICQIFINNIVSAFVYQFSACVTLHHPTHQASRPDD